MRNTMKAVFFATATLFGIDSHAQTSCGSGHYDGVRVRSITTNESSTNGKFAVRFYTEDGTYYYAASGSGLGTETPGGKNNFDQLVDAGRLGLDAEIWCINGDVESVDVHYEEIPNN